MQVLKGYFDGKVVQTLENLKLKKNQKLIITVLDEFLEEVPKVDVKKSARGILKNYANKDLIKEEKKAWEKAVIEKYDNS